MKNSSSLSLAFISIIGLLLHIQFQRVAAINYLIKTLSGHGDSINSVAVTPDGSKVVSGGNEIIIKIWNLSDGTTIRTLEGHEDWIYSLAITPDGSKIVSASGDGIIKIWNLSDGTLINTWTAHNGVVYSIAITPDGSKIVSVSDDKAVMIWNISDGSLIRKLTGHNGFIYSVAISSDGTKIVSGSSNSVINIWNLSDGSLIRTISGGHNGVIYSVTLTPDGSKIISGGKDHTIIIWNISDGGLIRQLYGHDSWVQSVIVTPDGSKIISGGDDHMIKIWNISDGVLIRTLTGHYGSVPSIFLIPGDSKLVSGGWDYKIRVWELSDLLPPVVKPADWYDKKKSEGFGVKVALLNNIAAISVPFCITPSNSDSCDGGNILTYKKDDATGWWMKHKKLRNPFRNRDNMFGRNMLLNSDYLIVSAPGSNYISTDVGTIVFYKWSEVQDTFLKESFIRFRKTTKTFEFGTAISNIDKITAVGMPTCDDAEDTTNSGCALVYRKKDDGKWGKRYTITVTSPGSNDRFGQSVSLGSDTTLAVSNNPNAASDQAVFIYGYKDNQWKLLQTLPNNSKLGFGWRVAFHSSVLYVSIVNDGTDKANAGSITTYAVNGDGQYVASSIIIPETSIEGKHFGFSFCFSSDGSRLVVGARPCEDNQACNIRGSVHVFTKNAGDWAEYYHVESTVADGSDGFGHEVAVEGDMILASAPFDSTGSLNGKTYFIKK